jgi:hypothetical protein
VSDDFQFDVFLSHSAKDKAVVRDVAARLQRDGVRVWLDEEQIKPGDSIPAKIAPPPLTSCGGTGAGLERSPFGFQPSAFSLLEKTAARCRDAATEFCRHGFGNWAGIFACLAPFCGQES